MNGKAVSIRYFLWTVGSPTAQAGGSAKYER